MILPFDEHGNLPPGVHWASWDELVARYGDGHRIQMLWPLLYVLSALRDAGCEAVYIDGSFVTAADTPRDIDIVWDVAGVRFDRLDPVLLERFPRITQRTLFACELFPSNIVEAASRKPFFDYFQIDHEGRTKGIVAVDLRGIR